MPSVAPPPCHPTRRRPVPAGLPAGRPGRPPAWADDPEVALMQRVQGGDTAAFEELQRRYAGRVFGYFCRQLRDRAEAEDLTQEVFLRLFRARHSYHPRA